MDCIKQGLERNLATILIAATLFAIIAAVIAAYGGLTIALGPITLAAVSSAILAAVIVFGAIVGIAVLAIVLNCAVGASRPSQDQVPPEDDGIQPDDLSQPGEANQGLTGEEDPPARDSGGEAPTKPRPKHPKDPPLGSPANPIGSPNPKKDS
ncbi:hypothetical protein N4R57_10880 [Rhodobacteraceae bacterium D3-12]|nr:hypothetical protein N4R57_10880 [Rhodobacteraceae bacterium D3-12]